MYRLKKKKTRSMQKHLNVLMWIQATLPHTVADCAEREKESGESKNSNRIKKKEKKERLSFRIHATSLYRSVAGSESGSISKNVQQALLRMCRNTRVLATKKERVYKNNTKERLMRDTTATLSLIWTAVKRKKKKRELTSSSLESLLLAWVKRVISDYNSKLYRKL